ncbi:hypothetical protein MJ1_0093 [Nanobdella aerobiophila]|uniref:Uncharacterized protein n=1 Tax=Nanobdella aerobiophila TaxID=2586965 RepID=A0A915SCC5_9ARCH|nr:hypothetical protein [Nanobdella aerobiophila]BBL45268.1 hypothetical protein MJ1_0093 [Nanobdella aerobiophila]
MFEYIKINKNVFYYLVIVAFFLSFNKWDTVLIGITNLVFSIFYIILSYFIILIIFNLVASWYGLYISLDLVIAELKMLFSTRSMKFRQIYMFIIIYALIIIFLSFIFRNNLFLLLIFLIFITFFYYISLKNFLNKDKGLNITIIRRLNLSYIISIVISIISLGFLVPIIFSMKPIVIEYKRIGRNKNLEVSNNELIRIFLISMTIIWLIFSIIKYLASISPIIYGFTTYFFYFLLFFTYLSIIPLGIILSPFISVRSGYSYSNKFIGDILILSQTPFYLSSISILALLPIFSLIFNPIEIMVFISAIFFIIWIRKNFDSLAK